MWHNNSSPCHIPFAPNTNHWWICLKDIAELKEKEVNDEEGVYKENFQIKDRQAG